MATAFDDQPQIVFAGKVNGRDNVIGIPGGDCIGARRGGPSVHPTSGLRRASLVADIERVSQVLDDFPTACTFRCAFAVRER